MLSSLPFCSTDVTNRIKQQFGMYLAAVPAQELNRQRALLWTRSAVQQEVVLLFLITLFLIGNNADLQRDSWDICMWFFDFQDFSLPPLSSSVHFPLLCVGGWHYLHSGQPLTQPHASCPATHTLPLSTCPPSWTLFPTFGVNKWPSTDFNASEFCECILQCYILWPCRGGSWAKWWIHVQYHLKANIECWNNDEKKHCSPYLWNLWWGASLGWQICVAIVTAIVTAFYIIIVSWSLKG